MSLSREEAGRAQWNFMHRVALECQSNADKRWFKKYLFHLSQHFPCEQCRDHMQKMFKMHPINSYWDVKIKGKDVGMFKYSWMIHNEVNKRLGKPTVDFEVAYMLWNDPKHRDCKEKSCEYELDG